MDTCMTALVHKGELPEGVTDVPPLPIPSKRQRREGEFWWRNVRWWTRLEDAHTLVLDVPALEAVLAFYRRERDRMTERGTSRIPADAEKVIQLVEEAYRHREGIILHSDCEIEGYEVTVEGFPI